MSCTDTTKLRGEFEAQLKDADAKIAKVKEELVRLNEYRTKLQGGLETLGLLDEQKASWTDHESLMIGALQKEKQKKLLI